MSFDSAAFQSFEREVRRVAALIPEEEVVAFQTKLTLEAAQRIIKRTPVDRGSARAAWVVSIGSLPSPAAAAWPENESGDPAARAQAAGADAMARAAASLRGLTPFAITFVSNNQPHIETLELGGFIPPDPGPSKDPRKFRTGKVLVRGGYSTQAPRGMVAITSEELRDAIAGAT